MKLKPDRALLILSDEFVTTSQQGEWGVAGRKKLHFLPWLPVAGPAAPDPQFAEAIPLIGRDLRVLLKLEDRFFWANVLYNQSFAVLLRSFLAFSPRPHELGSLDEEVRRDVLVVAERVLRVVVRMAADVPDELTFDELPVLSDVVSLIDFAAVFAQLAETAGSADRGPVSAVLIALQAWCGEKAMEAQFAAVLTRFSRVMDGRAVHELAAWSYSLLMFVRSAGPWAERTLLVAELGFERNVVVQLLRTCNWSDDAGGGDQLLRRHARCSLALLHRALRENCWISLAPSMFGAAFGALELAAPAGGVDQRANRKRRALLQCCLPVLSTISAAALAAYHQAYNLRRILMCVLAHWPDEDDDDVIQPVRHLMDQLKQDDDEGDEGADDEPVSARDDERSARPLASTARVPDKMLRASDRPTAAAASTAAFFNNAPDRGALAKSWAAQMMYEDELDDSYEFAGAMPICSPDADDADQFLAESDESNSDGVPNPIPESIPEIHEGARGHQRGGGGGRANSSRARQQRLKDRRRKADAKRNLYN